MTDTLPLGIRNNNPGNIRFISRRPFKGQTGENKGFGTYDTMENGIRAAAKQIRSYIRQGYNCPRTIIARWAPSYENDTEAYVKSVVQQTGSKEYAPISENNELKISDICWAIFCHENGMTAAEQYISNEVFVAGIHSAFEGE